MRKTFSAAERQQITSAYAAGEKLEVIAARFGCDMTYPRVLARRAKLPGRRVVARGDYRPQAHVAQPGRAAR